MIQAGEAPFWGVWKGLLFAVLLMVVFVAVQVIAVQIYAHQLAVPPDAVPVDGTLIAFATLASSILCSLLLMLFVLWRAGDRWRDALGVHMPSLRSMVVASVAVLLMAVCSNLLIEWAGKPVIPPFMQQAYDTAQPRLLLWLAVVIAAPVFEELLFRGYLYQTWASSSSGGVLLAIVAPAVLWSMLHLQYEPFYIGLIALIGVALGWARWRSGSVILCMGMHIVFNFLAMLEVAFQ